MEKDIDEVGKIARQAKTKVDELEKDVCSCLTLLVISICLLYLIFKQHFLKTYEIGVYNCLNQANLCTAIYN